MATFSPMIGYFYDAFLASVDTEWWYKKCYFIKSYFWNVQNLLKIDKKQRKCLFTFVALYFIAYIEIYLSQNVEFVSKVNSSWHYHKNRLQLETIPDFSPKFSNMSCGKAIYFNRPVICPKCQSQITFRLNKGSICRSCSIHIF